MSAIYKSAAGERAVKTRYRELLEHWPVPNTHLHIPTRAGETFVIASGAEQAPPLVLLHGSAFNSVSWMGDVATWSRTFRVYAVDVIGHPGLSAHTRPAYDSDDYARWLDDVLDGLGAARCAIVGISLGGWIAADYAIRRPDRVTRLVLLCPGGIGRDRMSMAKLLFVILPLLLLGRRGRRKAMQLMLGGEALTPSREGRTVEAFMELITKHFRQNLQKLKRFSDAELSRIRQPLLLIVGGRDAMIDSGDSRARVTAHIPSAQVLYLPDAGHALLGLTAVIDEYLNGLE